MRVLWVIGTTRLAQLRAARAAAAAAAAAGGKPAGTFAPRASRRERLQMKRGTGRQVSARPFSIKVYIPGIMKQKSSSDMDVSNGSGSGDGASAGGFAPASGVRIEEMGDDSRASAGSGEGSKGSNINPFSFAATGAVDGPRPMFRPSTHILNAPATPGANAEAAFKSRPSTAGTPNAAEALAMMMHHEYPEGLPEDVHGVSHFGAGHDDEPPLMDFAGEADMDVGYDDDDNYAHDGEDLPPAPRKRTVSGLPHKRLRAEMDRRKSLALAGLQAAEGGVRRSTRQRSKPLEYWRGETKVYQRVHNSLPTVVQIEKRTANPIWPRKTPGGPSQPFRISRLRPAEVLRDIGGELPEPSPLDRRGVKYGLMPPPPPASWAEKYGIHPLTSSRPSVTPGTAPRDSEEDGIALKPAKKRRGRPVGSKNKKNNASVEDEEEHVNDDGNDDSLVADMVSEMFANVLAANRTPEEIEAEEQAAADAALEAQAIAEVEAEMAAMAEDDAEEDAATGVMEAIAGEEEEEVNEDEEERELERELDAAVADAERELAEELAAEAAADALDASEDAVVVEDVEESVKEAASVDEDAVELDVDFSRADTEATTSRDIADESAVEQPIVVASAPTVLGEIDANEEDVDMMDVDEPPSAQKQLADAVDDATNDENAPRRRTRSRGTSLAPLNI